MTTGKWFRKRNHWRLTKQRNKNTRTLHLHFPPKRVRSCQPSDKNSTSFPQKRYTDDGGSVVINDIENAREKKVRGNFCTKNRQKHCWGHWRLDDRSDGSWVRHDEGWLCGVISPIMCFSIGGRVNSQRIRYLAYKKHYERYLRGRWVQ